MREAIEERRERRGEELETVTDETNAVRSVFPDTSFLVGLTSGDQGAVGEARESESDLVQQRRSSVTFFALHYGAARSNQSDAEREKIENVLASKPVRAADSP